MGLKILVIGSGGREHALAWRIKQSDRVEQVFVAPGNAGTADEPGISNIEISPSSFDELIAFARAEDIHLTVIGPEVPLVNGIVDRFEAAGLRCFGPNAQAAQLEGSKSFSKDFLKKYDIPTADYRVFSVEADALDYAQTLAPPIVIKADGLAAGKGVVIADNHEHAAATISDMLSGSVLDGAGATIVIEEFLIGEEASFIIVADGKEALSFATSQDHKAAFDGDKGPNTGGMGAYSPAPVVTAAVEARIMSEVIRPTLEGMQKEGHPYTGFLYAGLMIDPTGRPNVIEFNCRFGDPETQPVMVRLQSDLVAVMDAALDGKLAQCSLSFDERAAITVVMASGGYPGPYETGKPITGLASGASDFPGVKVFHAGTEFSGGTVVSSGGRVLGVTALGESVTAARALAYRKVDEITFQGAIFRRDIGYRAIARENTARENTSPENTAREDTDS